MEILSIYDDEFKKYGKVVEGYDFSELLEVMAKVKCPAEGTEYIASVPELETTLVCKDIYEREYGQMPIQIGYCIGHNKVLDAVEYHRSSEINIAAGADMVLILGQRADIADDYSYDASLAKAFRVPEGAAVEIYATTLHYAPCHVDEKGFKSIVVLPEGTNTDLTAKVSPVGEDSILLAKNKWLINLSQPWIGIE